MNPLDELLDTPIRLSLPKFLKRKKKPVKMSTAGDDEPIHTPTHSDHGDDNDDTHDDDDTERAKMETIAGILSDEYLQQLGMTREEFLERIVGIGADENIDPNDTFQARCRHLGHLKLKLARACGNANTWLDPDQYTTEGAEIVNLEHAAKLLGDVEASFRALATKRAWCEEKLTEQELLQKPDYLAEPTAHLNEIRRLYGKRLDFEKKNRAGTTTTTKDDSTVEKDANNEAFFTKALSGAVSVAEANARQFASQFNTSMGLNFVLSEHMGKKFSGDFIEYVGFREKLDANIEKMRLFHKTDAEILQQLQDCLEGPNLKQIKSLPFRNENLNVALETLELLFGDKFLCLSNVLGRIFKVSKMDDTAPSLALGLSDMDTVWKQLQDFKMSGNEFVLHIFIAIVRRKLSPLTIKSFNKLLGQCSDKNSPTGVTGLTYEKFKKCIQDNLRDKQRDLLSGGGDGNRNKPPHDSHGRGQGSGGYGHPTLPRSFSTDTQNQVCIFCEKSNHVSALCFKMRKLPSNDILKICLDKKVCLRCFENGHRATKCTSTTNCWKKEADGTPCPGGHHAKLHGSFGAKQKVHGTKTGDGENREEKKNPKNTSPPPPPPPGYTPHSGPPTQPPFGDIRSRPPPPGPPPSGSGAGSRRN